MERTKSTSEARQRVLETADRLFYQDGIRAVGIDRIIAEAGVAKMSLYKHFPSKDDLILAVLRLAPGYSPGTSPGTTGWARASPGDLRTFWRREVGRGRPDLLTGCGQTRRLIAVIACRNPPRTALTPTDSCIYNDHEVREPQDYG